jgi:hypothetical protein
MPGLNQNQDRNEEKSLSRFCIVARNQTTIAAAAGSREVLSADGETEISRITCVLLEKI